MLKSILLSIFFFVSSFAAAADLTAEKIFSSAFHDQPRIYRAAQCGRNVYELAKLLESQGVVLQNPEVIFFLSEFRKVTGIPMRDALRPAAARGHDPRWDFHVILTAENPDGGPRLVYDLDWHAKSAPLNEYLASMFPNTDGERYTNLTIRRIPLSLYMESLAEAAVDNQILLKVGEFRKANILELPTQTLESYLSK